MSVREPKRVEHVVWDWNGTLLDDNDAVLAAVNSVCAEFDRPPVTLAQWRAIFRRPLTACYEDLLDRRLSESDWAVIDRSYHTVYRRLLYSTFPIASRRSHGHGHEQPARTVASDVGSADGKERATIRLAPGVPNLLHEWRGGGKTQSLLSMWFHSELVELITELGLAELFTHVNGLRAETGGGSKAEHLVAHLSAKGLDPARVVVIGDVADDAVAAERAGAHCVLVSSGMMDRRALRAANVPVVDSIDHAMRLVHDWAGPRQRGADE